MRAMILDVRPCEPEPDDLRAALRRHIDYPTVAADDKTLGQRLGVGACGGPLAPAPRPAAPPPSNPSSRAQGARRGAGASRFNPLEDGRVWARPACVGRYVWRARLRRAAVIVIASAWIAAGVVALVVAW